MSETIFKIRNLSCSYNLKEADKVLQVDSLDIERGEVIFLLGASGSGKSTLLETLGMMNNTLAQGDVEFITAGAKPVSFAEFWSAKDEVDISLIRKNHFSFIFQNTNLMENFTAYENICISSMIKDNRSQAISLKGARELMVRVGLPENQVTLSTLATHLSGGQKQRIAFVRALNSNYSVLFGDEPTGNLDEENANELMALVKTQLSPQQTAIIVSHDINLALNHATRIITITKEPGTNFGVIKAENNFSRKQWVDLDTDDYIAFRDKLKGLYKHNTDHVVGIRNKEKGKIKAGKKYKSLFLQKEGLALLGRGWVNFWLMVVMMSLTFLAIGFANGSLSYLDAKIKNPFVNWLTITIPHLKQDDIPGVLDELNKPAVKSEYNYKGVSGFIEQPFRFWSREKKTYVVFKGRSIDMSGNGDPLMEDILKPQNQSPGVTAHNFRDENDMSIIVTSKMLKRLGYPVNNPYIIMEVPVFDTTLEKMVDINVPIQIKAIVNEIPGKVEFLYTNRFLQAYRQRLNCVFDYRDAKEVQFYFEGSMPEADRFKNTLQDVLKSHPLNATNSPGVNRSDLVDYSFNAGYVISIDFYPSISDYTILDRLYDTLITHPAIAPFMKKAYRIYDFSGYTEGPNDALKYDVLSVSFITPEKVEDFSYYLISAFNDAETAKAGNGILEVDMGKVQEKKNFMFISKLATIVAYIIILFGSIAVSLFVFNMLKMHLSKVKMNIGTFKAFGLLNSDAQLIYFTIILLFATIAMATAFLFAYVIGSICNYALTQKMQIEAGNYFKLFDLFTTITIVLILISTTIVSWITIKYLLNKTPGDLIYNRK